jgi:hypothetical protein
MNENFELYERLRTMIPQEWRSHPCLLYEHGTIRRLAITNDEAEKIFKKLVTQEKIILFLPETKLDRFQTRVDEKNFVSWLIDR